MNGQAPNGDSHGLEGCNLTVDTVAYEDDVTLCPWIEGVVYIEGIHDGRPEHVWVQHGGVTVQEFSVASFEESVVDGLDRGLWC